MIRCLAAAAMLGSLAVPAMATPQCSVATGAQLLFGTVVVLERTGDKTTDSASSFWINCNSEVIAAPQMYATGARVMQSGTQQLPFKLSLVSPGGGDLPAGSPGTALDFPHNGANQTVTLYGKILVSDFKSLPGGLYSGSVHLTIEY
ncbi:spore coat protein U domain-containing protein [Caenimonas terrae]|uniref:Spore coat protein U domain-containing protein n=1 Tax=Caenimonas terrae TaxID=696074 RepID=A0ABW0NIE0_9BURK